MQGRTSFQRCLCIFSTPVIGSMNTSFATRVSGTHIAQRRCTQSPVTVCLKAPASLGHNMQDLKKHEPNVTSARTGLRRDFREKLCTSCRATVLLGCTEPRNSLHKPINKACINYSGDAYPGVQLDYTRHRIQSHYCFLLPNHRIQHMWNPQKA